MTVIVEIEVLIVNLNSVKEAITSTRIRLKGSINSVGLD